MATSSTSSYIPSGQITYDVEEVDNSNDFNPATGTFTVPKTGMYQFFFNAYVNREGYSRVYVYLNGNNHQFFYHEQEGSSDRQRQLSAFWSMQLNKDDEVYMENPYANSILVDIDRQLYFMGYLVN